MQDNMKPKYLDMSAHVELEISELFGKKQNTGSNCESSQDLCPKKSEDGYVSN